MSPSSVSTSACGEEQHGGREGRGGGYARSHARRDKRASERDRWQVNTTHLLAPWLASLSTLPSRPPSPRGRRRTNEIRPTSEATPLESRRANVRPHPPPSPKRRRGDVVDVEAILLRLGVRHALRARVGDVERCTSRPASDGGALARGVKPSVEPAEYARAAATAERAVLHQRPREPAVADLVSSRRRSLLPAPCRGCARSTQARARSAKLGTRAPQSSRS